ncbi:MAG: ribosome-associated translation inhibitor RaiA, partial [Candidatus Pacebacteria bacterium]|nr:ribosome-associated translation inhibitor RaiA [Candidatus Paceibacterota bacterium]
MKINLTSNHGLQITNAITKYIEHKFNVVGEKFNLADAVLDIELEKTNNHHNKGDIYGVSLKITHSVNNIFISEVSEDLYVTIDKLEDKLKRELSNYKDKKKTLLHRFGKKMKDMIKRDN